MKNVVTLDKINLSIGFLKLSQTKIRRGILGKEVSNYKTFQTADAVNNLHVAIVGLSYLKAYMEENNIKEIKI